MGWKKEAPQGSMLDDIDDVVDPFRC